MHLDTHRKRKEREHEFRNLKYKDKCFGKYRTDKPNKTISDSQEEDICKVFVYWQPQGWCTSSLFQEWIKVVFLPYEKKFLLIMDKA